MKRFTLLLASCLLAACGGGSTSSPVSPAPSADLTISGTAATGKAIAGAILTGKCQAGTGSATTGADGSYSMVVSGGKLPCLLQITDPADGSKLHTMATGSSVTASTSANVTPLTEMLAARVLGKEPAVFFAAFDATVASSVVTAALVKAAQTDVAAVLTGIVDASVLQDFISTPLKAASQSNPNGGDAQDKLLDTLRTRVNAAQLTQVVAALANNKNTVDVKQVVDNLLLRPPVAQAGAIQNVVTGTLVTLDGSASTAESGRSLSYAWTLTSKPAGSMAILASTTSARPTFTADQPGTYVATLIVNDGKANSSAAAVSITVSIANAAPVANAGATQQVLTGSVVTLDGSASSDANGDALTFAWALTSRPGNSAAVLSAPDSAKPHFIADVAGVYVAKLIVSDGLASSAAETVAVTATVADIAGPVVSAIAVTPSIADVSSSAQLVTATVVVTDFTGINLTSLPEPYWFQTSDVPGTRINSAWVLVSGDAKQATFRSSVTIPAGAKAGDWLVGSIAFRDILGNSSTNGGHQQTFTVTSNQSNDTSGPVVSAISVTPSIVDVSLSSQLVTATVVVTDFTGINLTSLPEPYWFQTSDVSGTRINSVWVLVSGNAKQATFRSSVTIPAGAKAGDWLVGSVAFRDILGYASTNGGHQQRFTVK